MVKGILLENRPEMELVTDCEILGNLDPINKIGENECFGGENGNDIVKRNFFSQEYYISTYTITDQDRMHSMWVLLDTLSQGARMLFKAFMYGKNTIITAYPRYGDKEQDQIYTDLIFELQRFTAFSLRDTMWNKEETAERLLGYVELCVVWPGKNN